MKALLFLADRLKERSTWVGLAALASALGVVLTPEAAEAIIAAGTAVAGLVAIVTRG